MSLILRNSCQPALDDAGLGNFHIAVDISSRSMNIVGECGQMFVSISGIQFARSTPSAAEIPLALELLEAFLIKHKPDFDLFIKAEAKFKAQPVYEACTDAFFVFNDGYRENIRWKCKVTCFPFEVTIAESGKVSIVAFISRGRDYTLQDLKPGFDVKLIEEGRKYIKLHRDWLDAGADVRALKAKLSTCEI